MVDERIIELINKEIDGTILPDELTRLQEYRSGNAEARKVSGDLNLVAAMLREVQHVEPPSTLKARVMHNIHPAMQRVRQPIGETFRSMVVDFFRPRSGFRFAYAFSGGVLAGIALVAIYLGMGGRSAFDSNDAIGTMISSSSKNLQAGREYVINDGNVRGVVSTQHGQEISVLNISLTTGSEIVTQISFDSGSLDMKAIRRSEDPGDKLVVSGGKVELKSTGNHTYAIYFGNASRSASSVRVTMLSSGNPLFDSMIALGPTAR